MKVKNEVHVYEVNDEDAQPAHSVELIEIEFEKGKSFTVLASDLKMAIANATNWKRY